jgi:two-component system, sensor histidine kinase and response regulator
MHRLHIERLSEGALHPAQGFLDRLTDLAIVCSLDGEQLLHLNKRAAEFFGWTESEILRFSPWYQTLLTKRSQERFSELIAQLPNMATGSDDQLTSMELLASNSGGAILPIRVHSIFIAMDSILILANDSVDGMAATEIVRQTQARFRSIVDSLSINLLIKDLDGRRLYANRAYLELRNLKLEDVLGKTDAETFPPDIAELFRRDDLEVIRTGKILQKYEENISQSGERTWTEAIKGPLRDADNNISGVQILFWDATDRKNAELAFERERYLLHALLDNIPDSIYFKDRDSRFVRISRGMAEKFKLPDTQSAIGKTDADIFSAEHAIQARGDELTIMQTGVPIVAQIERETWPDSPDTWCSTTKLPLRDANGEIVGTFGISRDITEMVEAENLLREARDVADSANQAKSDFLANMSHEIRTPMNGIIGMAELLRNTQLNDAQRSFLEMIDSSAHSLLRIINDILDFSKIEAGKLDLESVPFDLRKCVSHAAKSLATKAAEKSVELILELDPDVPRHLLGDPVRLRQVLVNLVGNAIKFTEDGEISVRVSVANGPPTCADYTLHFSVIDSGIGIPPKKQEKIFEAFSQADVSTTRLYGGTGLGLSISARLVEMMQGRIWLESEVGVGSTFHFTARLAAPTVGAEESLDDCDNLSLLGMQALIVDDNCHSREVLRNALLRRGLLVTACGTASEAIEAYQRFPTGDADRAILIVDQVLQDCEGIDLISQLHAQHPHTLPVTILLSTAAHPASEETIHLNHIDAVLQKPALQSEICLAIRRILTHENKPATTETNHPNPALLPGMRFLLAEDGAVNRAVFVGLLEGRGHQVTTVEDGQAAIDAWRDFYFHAIFMDVQMPTLDGLEATRIIRTEEANSSEHIPIIAITAAAMESDNQRCLDAGMDAYLSKPVDFAQLDRLLDNLRASRLAHVAGSESPLNRQMSGGKARASGAKSIMNLDAPLAKLKCTPKQQRQLVITLEKEAKQRLAELSRALDDHDDKLLVRASHSMKSAAALFEAEAVVEISAAMEAHARAGETSLASQYYPQLRDATHAMLSVIHAWLEEQ